MIKDKITTKDYPLLVPTILIVSLICVFFSQGIWQLKKHRLKSSSAAIVKDMVNENHVLEHHNIFDKAIEKFYYQPTRVFGEFLNDKDIYFYSYKKSLGNGASCSYQLFTPFKTHSGQIILVARGWIANKYKNNIKRNIAHHFRKGSSIVGYIIPTHSKPILSSFADCKNNIWYSLYLPEISKYLNLKLESFYILPKASENKDLFCDTPLTPIDDKEVIDRLSHNNHFSYFITWLSMALLLIVIYVLYFLRKLD